jgi:indolepyruvate decarboxylase
MQIDSAITACLSERRPVYLEVMADVWEALCGPPDGVLTGQERPFTRKNEEILGKAVGATVELVKKYGQPILWAGEEINRFGLAEEFTDLVKATGIPFCTSVGGKSVVSETTTGFHGVYNGKASDPEVRRIFKEQARCRIGLGSWSTSKNLAGEQSIGDDWAVAARDGVAVAASYFPDVQLARFIPALREKLVAEFGNNTFTADYFAQAHANGLPVSDSAAAYHASLSVTSDSSEKLTYDGFFHHVSSFLEEQAIDTGINATTPFTLISDAAFALLGSMNVRVVEQGCFLAQNSWLSIGYSVGAATGVAMARPEKRPLVFVGDGSFQETCQELPTHAKHGLRLVVFVLNNEGFYGVEQMLVNPCYYKDPSYYSPDFYNELHNWNYDRLAEVFRSEKTPITGLSISTNQDLEKLLRQLTDRNNPINQGPVLVQVQLSRHNYPQALKYKLEKC